MRLSRGPRTLRLKLYLHLQIAFCGIGQDIYGQNWIVSCGGVWFQSIDVRWQAMTKSVSIR